MVWIEIFVVADDVAVAEVTTLRVVWIEIVYTATVTGTNNVTTLRVVWIEILLKVNPRCKQFSPPCGWCGLKYAITQSFIILIGHHLAGGVD